MNNTDDVQPLRNSGPPVKKRRKNTTRACDRCKEKKLKCDGTQPCSRCTSNKETCSYEKPYHRGLGPKMILASQSPAPTTIRVKTQDPQSSQDQRRSRDGSIDVAHHGSYLGPPPSLVFSQATHLHLPTPPSASFIVLDPQASSRSSNCGSSSQPYNHDTSNDKTRNQSNQLRFPEPPFPELNLALFSLPTREQAFLYSRWYFENASPTYRVLHRPSVEDVINAGLYAGGDQSCKTLEDKSVCAVVFIVWALGCQYPLVEKEEEKQAYGRMSIQFYQCAQLQLEKEKSQVDRLATLQAKFLMCLYLLEKSRPKASWDLFALVKNMASNLDLNRRVRFRSMDLVHLESRRRVLWAIYTLDSYLCTMLGKTLTWDDNDVTEEYPRLVDDSRFTSIRIGAGVEDEEVDFGEEEGAPCLMSAPIAHAKLARIVRVTLRKLYGGPRSEKEELEEIAAVDDLAVKIASWEASLPEFLKMKASGSLLLIYPQQSAIIRLAHMHALILIYRPFLPFSELTNLSKPTAVIEDGGRELKDERTKIYQDRCLDAALKVWGLVSGLARSSSTPAPSWFTAYVIFCAATVMFVYVAQNPGSRKRDMILRAAERCFVIEEILANDNKIAQRYAAALGGLSRQVKSRLETMDHDNSNFRGVINDIETTMNAPPQPFGYQHSRQQLPPPLLGSLSNLPPQSQFPPTFPESLLPQVNNDDPEQSRSNPNSSGEGANLNEIVLQALGEDATFQDLDATVSGGCLFGWIDGPMY